MKMSKEMIEIENNRVNAFATSVCYKCPDCQEKGIDTDYKPYIDEEGYYHIHCEKCNFEPTLNENGEYVRSL